MDERILTAPDEEIASAIASSPRDELCAELFRRYAKRVYLWCFGYTHDVDQAVEMAQEILAKIFRTIGTFSGRSRFSTWAYQVTRNHCLAELATSRARWRRRLVALDEAVEPLDPGLAERVDQAEELERLLAAARERMSRDEIEAFVLHYREGLTVREITAILGCGNASGARTLIQGARRKFARLVREEGFGDG